MAEAIKLAAEAGFWDGLSSGSPEPSMNSASTPEAIRIAYDSAFLRGCLVAYSVLRELSTTLDNAH